MTNPSSFSTPPEIGELLVTSCTWQKWLGWDGHGEAQYDTAVTLKCFQEAHSMLQTGLEAHRVAEMTFTNLNFDLYFSGDDVNAEQFSLYDKFTLQGVGNSSQIIQQPVSINTVYGPPYDNQNPWLIVVSF